MNALRYKDPARYSDEVFALNKVFSSLSGVRPNWDYIAPAGLLVAKKAQLQVSTDIQAEELDDIAAFDAMHLRVVQGFRATMLHMEERVRLARSNESRPKEYAR